LTIGEEYKSFVDEGLKCMALNHGQKKMQEPEPIVVVFYIDDCIGKREQTTVGINRNGCQENFYIELGTLLDGYCSTLIHVCQIHSIKTKQRAARSKAHCTSPKADEQTFKSRRGLVDIELDNTLWV